VCQRLGRAVAASHADSLGEDLFELGRRSAGDQRPYQRQRVVVKVRLQRVNNQLSHVTEALTTGVLRLLKHFLLPNEM